MLPKEQNLTISNHPAHKNLCQKNEQKLIKPRSKKFPKYNFPINLIRLLRQHFGKV